MSVLQTINDIKIPYAVEGVIRTAQLDDTISPENSVQLAVNMNFDRVGALQTRPGVTSYADILTDGINNYGTLRNSITTIDYDEIFQLGDEESISFTFSTPTAVKVNETKVAVFWAGVDNDGFCRLLEVNQFTGQVSLLGDVLEFDTSNGGNNACTLIDEDVVLNVWTGADGDGFAQAFDVSEDTAVAFGTPFEFDTSGAIGMTVARQNVSHAMVFYTDNSNNGIAICLQINPISRDVSQAGSPLTFDSTTNMSGKQSCCLVAPNRFINVWISDADAHIQAFSVIADVITALDSPLDFSTNGEFSNVIALGDDEHVVCTYAGDTSHFTAGAFAYNPGTGEVTTVGTRATIKIGGGVALTSVGFGDGQHFVAFYTTTAGNGFAQMFNIDPSTFDASMIGNVITGLDFGSYFAPVGLSLDTVMNVWALPSETEGQAAIFQTDSSVEDGFWLYAASGDEIYNTSSGTWTSRRSGLAEVSKPRFAQFLNRIWMVNGNQQLGGDPVATSDGGAFDQTLVPNGFPKGDFINAGFEGRVWVVNKTLGIIYYTDIVQFTTTGEYVLTFNANVNFISTIAPQTGQTMTALYQVPRALLVFTEDTITRIYGATSLDAYPAYNVGTYSQESIIQTKTGIFFHHSSGFYQFDYGSQPVEISRRIIDFVKAIPRSYYPDITGVWDGFDNVEWSIGQVTVEGVVFSNCVVRYTISTQVWTIYDYPGNVITAMIYFDDGEELNHIMGTEAGKTGAMDVGYTDFGQPFYYEFIDRWRSYTDMYYKTKSISGLSVYSENAAGANVMFQQQKSGPNAWEQLFTITEKNNSMAPNTGTQDFDVGRLRIAGNTKGVPVVIHGIEITALTIKGQDTN